MTYVSDAISAMHPPAPAIIPGWCLTPGRRAEYERHVTIDANAITRLLPWLQPGPVNAAWRSYVGPVCDPAPDLARLFYELGLTISQFGGFVAHHGDGRVVTWKRDGSGIKALLATMDTIRAQRKLPQIDLVDGLEDALAPHFIRVPFGKERMDMLIQVGQPTAPQYFRNLLALARRRDGTYRFNALHMKGLACRFPLAFGEDPLFYKKASLLLMTMEIALNQLGQRAIAETLPPADYRIPQILEGVGILSFSPDVTRQIADGHVFRLDNACVHAIRAMTVEAVGLIKTAYEAHHRRPVSCAELDGVLYLLSRNRDLMAQRTMKPHMLVATHAF